MKDDTVVMFRPTGPKEWALVAESGYKRWPPRPWAQDDSCTLATPAERVYPWTAGQQELDQ